MRITIETCIDISASRTSALEVPHQDPALYIGSKNGHETATAADLVASIRAEYDVDDETPLVALGLTCRPGGAPFNRVTQDDVDEESELEGHVETDGFDEAADALKNAAAAFAERFGGDPRAEDVRAAVLAALGA